MDISARTKLPGCSSSLPPPILHSKTSSVLVQNSIPFQRPLTFFTGLQVIKLKARTKRGSFGAIHASNQAENEFQERWLLEPVGDGDSRHIGFKVKMPDAFEIASSEVTVGRLPDKADMVIPVATVSALHARIQRKEGNLLVTDLDSTNGTFIDDKRLRPGVVASVSPGCCITFGDIHLAMFRVSKLENVETPSETEESEDKVEKDNPTESKETAN